MASITDAFKIIAKELPQFFTQTGTPFLGKDQEGSVMKEKDAMQKEKEFIEALTTAGILATPVGKGIVGAGKVIASKPKTAALLTAAATQDPTMLLPGGLGLLAQSNDAEAMVVPAHLAHSFDDIYKVVAAIAKGKSPKFAYEDSVKNAVVGGIYSGPLDNDFRTVISDKGAMLTGIKEGKLGDFMDHPDLFNVIPKLKNMNVKPLSKEAMEESEKQGLILGGNYDEATDTLSYNPNLPADKRLSIMLHEIQHPIQTDNLWVPGSHTSYSKNHPNLKPMWEEGLKTLGDNPAEADIDKLLNGILFQIYKKGAGETEARFTENAFLRKSSVSDYPLDKYDVPVSELLWPINK